jgi:Flp pilus assembly pilin Flp
MFGRNLTKLGSALSVCGGRFRQVLHVRRAVTAVEYAIIAGVMAAALVASVPAIAPSLNNTFNKLSTEL